MSGAIESRKAVKVRGIELGDGNAQICIPLVGTNKTEIIKELEVSLQKKPDLVEWRADFFEDLHDTKKMIEALSTIRSYVNDLPILFTIRSTKEGGNPIPLSEEKKLELIVNLCATGNLDIVDYELVNKKEDIHFVREQTNKYNVRLILSYHNFERTPEATVLMDKCIAAKENSADLVKLAVMSQSLDDVMLLMQVTQEAAKSTTLPLVTISMGKYGAITRMFGFVFGSTITFGVGQNSSAPGQIPVDDLRQVINIIKRATN
ncbi:type I 3-dehydroquinate dehydratase [Halalkalibacter krulwichiae]|nr:type I 3-dehydroquinate dehydratase [Halalkalibacter krulwichiae]